MSLISGKADDTTISAPHEADITMEHERRILVRVSATTAAGAYAWRESVFRRAAFASAYLSTCFECVLTAHGLCNRKLI